MPTIGYEKKVKNTLREERNQQETKQSSAWLREAEAAQHLPPPKPNADWDEMMKGVRAEHGLKPDPKRTNLGVRKKKWDQFTPQEQDMMREYAQTGRVYYLATADRLRYRKATNRAKVLIDQLDGEVPND